MQVSGNQKDLIVYDGDCGFCERCVTALRHIDRANLFLFKPFQHYSEAQLQGMNISKLKCERKIHLVTSNGKSKTGATVINAILVRYFPWKILVWLLYVIPILLAIEHVGYFLTAKYRHRLSAWLGLQVCRTAWRPKSQ